LLSREIQQRRKEGLKLSSFFLGCCEPRERKFRELTFWNYRETENSEVGEENCIETMKGASLFIEYSDNLD
jgi:hypothetical protein